VLGVATVRLGLHIVPPHIFLTLTEGPGIFVSHATGLAADAAVYIKYSSELLIWSRFLIGILHLAVKLPIEDFGHCSPPILLSGEAKSLQTSLVLFFSLPNNFNHKSYSLLLVNCVGTMIKGSLKHISYCLIAPAHDDELIGETKSHLLKGTAPITRYRHGHSLKWVVSIRWFPGYDIPP
jgi:hypothetical protein